MGCVKRLSLKNVINCRDLGGFPCADGRVTQFGRFLRCGVPKTPEQDEIVTLMQYGVSTVIDLRGNWESETYPSVFKFLDGVDYHHVSLFEANVAVSQNSTLTIAESYQHAVEDYKDSYRKVLEIIADAKDGCVLFNCYFGKDRTGILAAVLLSLAGVAYEDIIADYQVSYTYILPFIQRARATHDESMWETNDENFKSDADTLASLINYMNKKYGSVEGYVKSAGVSDETIEKIRRRFF